MIIFKPWNINQFEIFIHVFSYYSLISENLTYNTF
nr:MAG TPA: hypothetical protein [Caudoviricetes sp.]